MSKIPEPQRERLIGALSHGLGRAKLRIDGREVVFEARLEKSLVYTLLPFVNGEFRGAWLLESAELDETGRFAQRLMRPRIQKFRSAKKLKELNRFYRKVGIEPVAKEKNERRYLSTWHCPKALVRHLEREFDTIEILEPSDAPA